MTDNLAAFAVPPVVKTVTVRCAPERAFLAFTAEIDRWWPFASHSIGRAAVTCVIEGRVGGRVYQRAADGSEADWGEVVAWDPPRRFAMTWRVTVAPERAQLVAVEFTRVQDGTLVRLTHSGWEKLGDAATAAAQRGAYDNGWTSVFEQRFGSYAGTL